MMADRQALQYDGAHSHVRMSADPYASCQMHTGCEVDASAESTVVIHSSTRVHYGIATEH